MKNLIIFYSYTGKTKQQALSLAEKSNCEIDVIEVQDVSRPGTLKAYTAGCFAALKARPWPITGLDKDLKQYDKICILAPVWAGQPAPAIWNVLNQLPEGKAIKMMMVSGSGKSKGEGTVKALLEQKNCQLVSYQDIKG